MPSKKHMAAAISAFVIWGFFSLVLKPMHIYPAPDIVFYRVICCGMLTGIGLLLFRKSLLSVNLATFASLTAANRRKTVYLTILGALLLVSNWFFFVFTMNHISIKSASYAYLVCPILTTILAHFILHEKLLNYQWLAVGISVLSCIMLAFGHFRELLYSLIVALSYAFYLISQKQNQYLDKLFILSVQLLVAAMSVLPFYSLFSPWETFNENFYKQILLIAVLFTILPLWLNLYALRKINSGTMGILLYINPVINFLMAGIFFHEPVSWLQLAAYLLIVLSIFVFNFRFLRSSSKINSH